MKFITRWLGPPALTTFAAASAGCGLILGLDEFVDAPPPTETGGGGTGGGVTCEPEQQEACYEGPEGDRGRRRVQRRDADVQRRRHWLGGV